jgi:hypothetical protein
MDAKVFSWFELPLTTRPRSPLLHLPAHPRPRNDRNHRHQAFHLLMASQGQMPVNMPGRERPDVIPALLDLVRNHSVNGVIATVSKAVLEKPGRRGRLSCMRCV